MSNFKVIKPEEFGDNVFRMIGKDWMLITSSDSTDGMKCGVDYNTMTASWGGVGILWRKPVVFAFIRPERHTYGFAERNKRITMSFFDEKYRDALAFCGKVSGRDYDKAKECALTPEYDKNEDGRAVWFGEARVVIKAKKLYSDFIKKDCVTEDFVLDNYRDSGWHKMYVCEIEELLVR